MVPFLFVRSMLSLKHIQCAWPLPTAIQHHKGYTQRDHFARLFAGLSCHMFDNPRRRI